MFFGVSLAAFALLVPPTPRPLQVEQYHQVDGRSNYAGTCIMLQNLFISKIELRHEESDDIVPFTHHRNIDKIVVPLDEDLVKVRDKLLSVQVCCSVLT